MGGGVAGRGEGLASVKIQQKLKVWGRGGGGGMGDGRSSMVGGLAIQERGRAVCKGGW